MGFWGECFSAEGVATINCIPLLIGQIFNIALSAAGAVALFFVVWGGIKFIRSSGDPKQVEGARQTITYAIVGLIIVFMAYFIVYTISRFTGVDCIERFGFTQCLSGEQQSALDTPPPTDQAAQ